jgi:hypothetical protein
MSGFQENGTDIIGKLRLRYAIKPLTLNTDIVSNILNTGYQGYLFGEGTSIFNVTVPGAYHALLIKTSTSDQTQTTTGGSSGAMKHVYGYLPVGTYAANCKRTITTSSGYNSTTVPAYTSLYNYSTGETIDVDDSPSIFNLSTVFENIAPVSGGSANTPGNPKPSLSAPFSSAQVGGSGGGGKNPSNGNPPGAGGAGSLGNGGIINYTYPTGYTGSLLNGQDATTYGAGGGGGANWPFAASGYRGQGGPPGIIIIPVELATGKNVSSATLIDANKFRINNN